ncbi:Alkyl hydroperoxide reductase subunit F [Candidatus Omnitrophus magneticus]|uniref:Alkyl hydroperoxide reductase subunit F n=1 Tax=Candidatus Omnitrophus magneticus TaxID=1609969 RepID=A0A0F0CVH1_9BACT|nr:Alkyl hydroperoxide reductase subunit F [Candidatus Omnitrophus magneticus]
MSKIYDVIVIGAGPAGITASIYAVRKGLNTLIVTKDIGGQTAWSGDIENYVGYQFITGIDLTSKFEEHMKKYNIEIKEGYDLNRLEQSSGVFKIFSLDQVFLSKSVIIATGKRSRKLGVEGEDEFRNRGVAYCATCDGPVFAGKITAVIGGGNSALEAVLQLIGIAKHVYLINIAQELTGDAVIREKILNAPNLTVMNNTRVTKINGSKFVESISVEQGGNAEIIPLNGIFIEIGLSPNTDFESSLLKNEQNEIIVNFRNETNIPGVFAAGDVTNVPEKQIIIAAGEGAKAALAAFRYVMKI